MNVYRRIENFFKKIINKFWIVFITIHEYKNIFSKRRLFKQIKLTKEQKRQIDDFYKENYGKKIKYWWHRLYQSYTGKFDYRYIPEYIFTTKLETINNKRLEVLPYENKNMLSIIFNDKNIKIPKTFIMCVKGKFFDENRNIISKQEAIKILESINNGSFEAVVKVTIDTSSGKGVNILDIENKIDRVSKKNIRDIIDTMGEDFVIQEKIVPHKDFAKIYSNSINTLRVITYIVNDKIEVAPIIMRIGQGGAKIDNAHAGGMFIGVLDDGRLLPEAFTEYQKRYREHPDTKIVFDGYKLPKVEEIKKAAITLHKKLPMLDFISWDFTVDKDEKVVLIEANMHSQAVWVSQIAHGKSFFGENTAEILRKLGKIKNKKL